MTKINVPKRRRVGQRPNYSTSSSWPVVLVAVFFLACCCHHNTLVYAKEIEATTEWQLIGENDTIAAGMHVKMDLETSEKWVKLMDENDKDDDDENTERVTLDSTRSGGRQSTGLTAVTQVDAHGNVIPDEEEDDALSYKVIDPRYDYDMMHRTLSKLPPEEIERMGGMPELPGTTTTSTTDGDGDNNNEKIEVTPEQRKVFEERMKAIWEQRQADLKSFQKDHLADLPQLLKDRIQSIKEYLEQPQLQLRSFDLPDDENDDDDDNGSFISNDIVAVLKDLEYHLTDIDMARDFYTLGGWPLLTSLLADAVHESGKLTTTDNNQQQPDQEQQLSDEDWNKVNLIQAYAAWAIGTTVKNTGEFMPYALAKVEVPYGSGDSKGKVNTTPLDLILAQFFASSKAVIASTSPKDDYYDTVVMKIHKSLYALGGLLRANRQSQTHFCADQGPALLGTVLSDLAEEASAKDPPALPKDTVKVAQRLLALAQDIVMDVTLHASKSDQVDTAIRNAFSSPLWCSTILRFTDIPRLYETSLQTIQQLAPSCGTHWEDLAKIQQKVKEPLAHVHQNWLPDDLDEEILKERRELLDATVKAIQEAKQ